jgi:DMSO/TMAO reductase YedYZ molybdopterin-dependent catalytic subunit
MTLDSRSGSRPRRGLWWRGAIAGVLAGGAALGVGQFVAGITGASSSPVVAVGQLQIDFTPPWLKNFAIREFGSHDKQVLVGGILVVLAIFAACVGVAAMRRLAYGMAGLGVFAAVGLIAAASRPTATATSFLPTVFAIGTAIVVLRILVSLALSSAPLRSAGQVERAGATPEVTAADAWDLGPDTDATPARTAEPVPADQARNAAWARQEMEPAGPGRRAFLVAGTVTAAAAGLAALIGRALTERSSVSRARSALRIPAPASPVPPLAADTSLNVPGITPFVTSDADFYRVDTAIVLPQVDPNTWQLRIHGMVDREIVLTFDELIRRPLIEDYITLCCVSNPVAGPYIGNALWLGASLASVLREAGIKAGADQLLCTSVDGFTSGTPVQTVMDGRDALLAVAMNGQPLPVEHGFPARMVVPGLYGYVSATKWVTDIEVTTFAGNYAYWAQRGWSQQAPIKTESRIDVPTGSGPLKAGEVTVAGVAWAQHKGIDAVEVRVDRGPWKEARLAGVPGIDTWRQWALDWTATSGTHLIEARATDATGYTQTSLQEPPEPNGATGLPAVQVSVN